MSETPDMTPRLSGVLSSDNTSNSFSAPSNDDGIEWGYKISQESKMLSLTMDRKREESMHIPLQSIQYIFYAAETRTLTITLINGNINTLNNISSSLESRIRIRVFGPN